jgi:carbamate kinase
MGNLAVVALGGNAILKPHEEGSYNEQMNNIKSASSHIANLVKKGYNVVITHGNGPQVGNILLKNEIAENAAPVMPMDVCVAESQGQLGYMIQQCLINYLKEIELSANVASVISQVLVDENDYAFENPTKPVGPYYSEDEAVRLAKEKGWTMMEDTARTGYRRVVASPEPIEIVEKKIIEDLVNSPNENNIVITLGGGGVPVTRSHSQLAGVEAVVDKDLASQLLASYMKADLFIMLTDVSHVAINFQKPNEEKLKTITVSDAKKYLKEGHFPPGSMGPKILAAVKFVEYSEKVALITKPENLEDALDNKTGTYIVSG